MNHKILADFKLAVNESLRNCKATRDFQTSRVYQYHHDLNETPISVRKAEKIIHRLDRLWNIKTVQLYPEVWDKDIGYGWTLSKRGAAIQLPSTMRTVSYLIHEHSHGVVESFRTYFKEFNGIREPGHGPLFCGVMAFSLHWITGQSYVDIEAEMRYYSIRVLEKDAVLKFKKIFKGR